MILGSEMPVISQTFFQKLSDRLDAEYFRPEFLEVEKALTELSASSHISVKPLAEIAEIRGSAFYGSIRFSYAEMGIPFIRVADIKELSVDKHDLAYLPETFDKYKKQIAEIHKGWIVLSKSGATYGGIGIVPDSMMNCRVSRDVLGINANREVLNEYLAAYLQSKYGQLQFKRFRSLQAQPHLEIKKVNELLVVIPSKSVQEEIAQLIINAKNKMMNARKNLEEAEETLLKILGVSMVTLKKTQFKTFFSKLNRDSWSAEAHFPEYSDMIDAVKNKFRLVKFKDAVRLSKDTIEPEKEPTKKYRYVELRNVTSFGNIDGFTEIQGHSAPSRAKMVLRKGDVLIPSLSGSFDKIGLVTDEFNGCIGSTGFYIARSSLFDSWLLFTLLRSPIFQTQLEQRTTGTIMSSISFESIGNTLLPILPVKESEFISNKVRMAFQQKKEGLTLLNEAVQRTEQVVVKHSLTGSR
jgi:restriction endonuclease S subunit